MSQLRAITGFVGKRLPETYLLNVTDLLTKYLKVADTFYVQLVTFCLGVHSAVPS